MLVVKKNNIFKKNGKHLKTISCPKKVQNNSLKNTHDKKLLCSECNKNIIDTQFTSESELIEILENDRSTCIKISRFNPMFRFE